MTALLDTSKLIVGASGSGKTVTAKADVAELLDDRRHVVVIDPTGVWWGMRSSPDGDGPGYDLPIFGGQRGDVAITPDQGRTVASIILDQRVSAIVDLSEIHDSAGWRLFMDGFVSGLRKGVRGNFHFVLDEADEFAAERVADGIGFALRENLIWIAKRGRAQGFVPTWITQRPADIAKAVISQAQTIVAHQLILAHDQKAIDDYLKSKGSADTRKEVMASLAELQVGERWIYSPRAKLLEHGVTAPLSTFDSSRTPPPGQRLIEPRAFAELDISVIASVLKSAEPEETRSGGADDAGVASLKREIAGLKAEIAALRHDRETLEYVARHALAIGGRINADMAKLLDLFDDERPAAVDVESNANSQLDQSAPGSDSPQVPAAAGAPPQGKTPALAGDAPDREYRALGVLAAIAPAGLTEAAWTGRAGYARKGGAWQRRRRRYVDAGLIEERDGRWHATPAGIAAAGDDQPDMPAAGPELVAWWAARMKAAGPLLKLLAQVAPRTLKREAIAAQLGMSARGGAFNRHISALKAAELITENRKSLGIAPGLMGND